MSFNQNKFQVIKQAIPYELANFCFNYFLLKRDAVKFKYDRNIVAVIGDGSMTAGLGKISKYLMSILIMQTL